MQRKEIFTPGEYYHIYTRGVEKRKIFLDQRDYERFMICLYILNQKKRFHFGNFLVRPEAKLRDIYEIERDEPLVSILGFSLMPNHIHLLVKEISEGGISKFMGKLLTSYSMYFNTKMERSGALFVKPFRSQHAGEDIYFRHLFNYIHLNCLDVCEPGWKENGISNLIRANNFLSAYEYSSYPDFIKSNPSDRSEAKIVDWESVPDFITRTPLVIEEFSHSFSDTMFKQ